MQKSNVRKSNLRRFVREASTLLVVITITLSAKSSLADHYVIPTGSMEPTVHVGDRIVVDKTSYDLRLPFSDEVLFDFGPPQRADIVVLQSPVQDLLLLKRVVAVPGDSVAVQGGRLIINSKPIPIATNNGVLVEQLGNAHPVLLNNGGGPDLSESLVPPGMFLVLGDNRGDSQDGRSFGFVSRSAILGRATRVYRSQGKFTWRTL